MVGVFRVFLPLPHACCCWTLTVCRKWSCEVASCRCVVGLRGCMVPPVCGSDMQQAGRQGLSSIAEEAHYCAVISASSASLDGFWSHWLLLPPLCLPLAAAVRKLSCTAGALLNTFPKLLTMLCVPATCGILLPQIGSSIAQEVCCCTVVPTFPSYHSTVGAACPLSLRLAAFRCRKLEASLHMRRTATHFSPT
jgi:hypothetical protein